MPLVDTAGDVGVAAGTENGRGTGIRVHAGEIRRRQGKAAVLFMDRFRIVQEEGALRFIESSCFPAKNEGAEFEAGIHVWKERWQVSSEAAVFEVEKATHPSAGGNGFEEAGRGLVGVNARRGQQAHKAIRLDQAHGPLDEQRVQVDVAAAEQRVVAGSANHLPELLCALLGVVELSRKGRSLIPQALNAFSPAPLPSEREQARGRGLRTIPPPAA